MSLRLFCYLCLLMPGIQVAMAQAVDADPSGRYQVSDTREPHNLVCQITVLKGHTGTRATAFLVAGNVLISAGHVFRESLFSKIRTLTVCVGRRNTDSGNRWLLTKTYERKQLRILRGHSFIRKKIPAYDYAFVALPGNISSSFFQTGEFNRLRATADSFFLTGYPEDKGYTSMWEKGDRAGSILEKDRLLLYHMYTWQGDSGAPVWCMAGGRYCVAGIHSVSNYHNSGLNAGVKFSGKDLERLQLFISRYTLPQPGK